MIVEGKDLLIRWRETVIMMMMSSTIAAHVWRRDDHSLSDGIRKWERQIILVLLVEKGNKSHQPVF